jgi:NAD(P)-dependent dehydrogenase (short-subunit alcohol dehydrogenase family)
MGDLEGRVAFVTGAGRGLGVSIALALAKAGASVGLMGRTRDTLEQTHAKIAEIGGRSLVTVGDVGVRSDVDRAVAEVQDGLGPIWGLVNNAFSATHTAVEDISEEVLDSTLRSCVHGSLFTMQACFPTMKERGGRIVNFGSGGATMGLPYNTAYNIAKEAIRGLTKTAAVSWGHYGITVNTICPLATSDAYMAFFNSITDEERRKHLEGIPLQRLGDPEQEVGGTIVFLLGPSAGFITSRTIHVDGGNCAYDK